MQSQAQRRILIVEDDDHIAQLLQLVLAHEGHAVTRASSGEEGFRRALELRPDLIISDVVMGGMDGYSLCRRLRQQSPTRFTPILMLTSKAEIADKVRGFEAGVDDYLTKPFEPQEVVYRVRNLLARGTAIPPAGAAAKQAHGIVLFGAKGGVGKTTIAVNLALALRQLSGKEVALIDADYSFGDLGVALNVRPKHGIVDLVSRIDQLDADMLQAVLVAHPSGVRVLVSPPNPEEAELITPQAVDQLLLYLSSSYEFIVVDCPVSYDERTLLTLEWAHEVMLVVTPEVGALKNTAAFFELAPKLGLPLEKIHVILNRADSNVGLDGDSIERVLRRRVPLRLPTAGRTLVMSVNRGVPLVAEQPKHPFARQILGLAAQIVKRVSSSTPPG